MIHRVSNEIHTDCSRKERKRVPIVIYANKLDRVPSQEQSGTIHKLMVHLESLQETVWGESSGKEFPGQLSRRSGGSIDSGLENVGPQISVLIAGSALRTDGRVSSLTGNRIATCLIREAKKWTQYTEQPSSFDIELHTLTPEADSTTERRGSIGGRKKLAAH